MALRARPDDEVDLYLEVVRADRDVDALALSPGPLDHPGHGRLGQAEEPENAVVGSARRLQHTLDSRRLERPRPQPLELPRRPGQHDHDAPLHLQDKARCCAGQAERLGAFRDRRLLPNAGLELLVRAPKPLREPADDLADLALEGRIDAPAPGRRPGPVSPRSGRRASARAHRRSRRGLRRATPERPPRAPRDGLRRPGCAPARSRGCSARAPGTGRSRRCDRRGRAHSP